MSDTNRPPPPEDLDALVTRAFEALPAVDAARPLLAQLSEREEPRARFAACLLTLELARHGDAEAREELPTRVPILLDAWRDPDLAFELCSGVPALKQRFKSVAPLLAQFESQRAAASEQKDAPAEDPEPDPAAARATPPPAPAPTPAPAAPAPRSFDALVTHCFEVRTDRAALEEGLSELATHEGSRAEFARCLLSLELAKLGVKDAQIEFTQRAAMLVDAFNDRETADSLIGGNAALRTLWDALQPYLEEFFETLRNPAPAAEEDELSIDVEAILEEEVAAESGEGVEVELGSDDIVIDEAPAEEEISEVLEVVEDPAKPRPSPPPFRRPVTAEVKPLKRPMSGERKAPPPFARRTGEWSRAALTAQAQKTAPEAPDADDRLPSTLAFWKYAEEFLGRLPDENGNYIPRTSFRAGGKSEQQRLEKFARELVTRFPASPQAHALSSLTLLYVASHRREKTLFGAPNQDRVNAIRLALMQLDRVRPAAQVAVLFETDGRATREAFAGVVDIMATFLQFCARSKLDPMSAAAVKKFTTPS